jgi:hypothetical protein
MLWVIIKTVIRRQFNKNYPCPEAEYNMNDKRNGVSGYREVIEVLPENCRSEDLCNEKNKQ